MPEMIKLSLVDSHETTLFAIAQALQMQMILDRKTSKSPGSIPINVLNNKVRVNAIIDELKARKVNALKISVLTNVMEIFK